MHHPTDSSYPTLREAVPKWLHSTDSETESQSLAKVLQLVRGRSGIGTQGGHPVPKYCPLYQVADTTCLFSGGSGHLLPGLWLWGGG